MEERGVLRRSDLRAYIAVTAFRLLWFVGCTLYMAALVFFWSKEVFAPGIIDVFLGAALGLLLELAGRKALRSWTVSKALRAHGSAWRFYLGPPNGYDMIYTLVQVCFLCVPLIIGWILHIQFAVSWPWFGGLAGLWLVCVWTWGLANMLSGRKWYNSLPE